MLSLSLYLLGSDIEFNPVFFAYAAVSLKEVPLPQDFSSISWHSWRYGGSVGCVVLQVVLFINPGQVNSAVRDSLTPEDMEESVTILHYTAVKGTASQISFLVFLLL